MIVVEGTPLILRQLEEADLVALHIFKNDPEVASLLGGFSTGYSHQDLRDWLEFHRNRRDEALFAIAEQASNRCIGHVGLYEIDFRIGKAEFAILIGEKSSQGKGWGKKIARAMIDYGFETLRLNKITGKYLSTNERVFRLNTALGFKTEGVLRQEQFRDGAFQDIAVMSILRDEWLVLRSEAE